MSASLGNPTVEKKQADDSTPFYHLMYSISSLMLFIALVAFIEHSDPYTVLFFVGMAVAMSCSVLLYKYELKKETSKQHTVPNRFERNIASIKSNIKNKNAMGHNLSTDKAINSLEGLELCPPIPSHLEG